MTKAITALEVLGQHRNTGYLNDHNPPVIIQGDSINASVEEDKESAWTIPEITTTDPNGEVLTWALHAQASKGTASVSGTGNTHRHLQS